MHLSQRSWHVAIAIALVMLPALALAGQPKAYLYVVQDVDLNGSSLSLVVPVEELVLR